MPFFKIAVYVASLSPFTLNIALVTMDIEEAGTRLRPAPRPSRYVLCILIGEGAFYVQH